MDQIAQSTKIIQLADAWRMAKEAEIKSIEVRRKLEDELSNLIEVDSTHEGTINCDIGGYSIKIVSRMNRKVDSEMLQEIAAENGLSEHLYDLFRWKPDIDMKAWKAADQSITSVLSQAITTTAGRPSYSITKDE